jgi:hypothetical protein
MNDRPGVEKKLKKLARISAWLLVALIVLTAIAGYGITSTFLVYKLSFGMIDRGLANALHRWSQPVLAAVVLFHVLINIHLRLPRRLREHLWLADGLLIIVGLAVLGLVVYLAFNPALVI